MAETTPVGLILNTLRFNRGLTSALLKDVDDERMVAQPSGVVNHAAWQVGHIVTTLSQVGRLIGSTFELPADWEAKFGMGSKVAADREANPAKAELLATLERACAAFEQALGSAGEETLAKQMPDSKFRMIMPTLADAALFVAGAHYSYHLGQLSAWRRAQGLPSALGV